jgi:hypothetical protein
MDPAVAYIDVDDTLVRSAGAKRIPIPSTVAYVRKLADGGCHLYCWSTGGADYAREVATQLGIEHCFKAFLPKPELIVDDVEPQRWLRMRIVYQAELPSL